MTDLEHSIDKHEWHANGNGGSAIMDVLLDSLIAGGSAAFALFAALPGVPDHQKAWASFVAFGVAFFTSLAAARRRRGDGG